MKKTKALLLISLSSALVACGGGVDQPKPVGPTSSVAVSSSSAVVSSSSVAVSSSSVVVSSSSVADSSSSVVVSSSSVADSSSSAVVSSSSEADSSSSVAVSSSSEASSSSLAANKVARLADTVNGDNGELRWNIPGTVCSSSDTTTANQKNGKLKVSFLRTGNLTAAGTEKNAYITLFNAATSTSSGRAVLDLQILNTQTTIRDQNATLSSAFPLNVGQWQTLEATWDYKGGAQAEITLMIDGNAATKVTYNADARAINGVCAIAFRVSDSAAILDNANMAFYVDDWYYYSDTAGTNLVMWDDFEAYSVNTNLQGAQIRTNNPEGQIYHSSTQDASVVELAKDAVIPPAQQ